MAHAKNIPNGLSLAAVSRQVDFDRASRTHFQPNGNIKALDELHLATCRVASVPVETTRPH
jgi:hypothetical protein